MSGAMELQPGDHTYVWSSAHGDKPLLLKKNPNGVSFNGSLLHGSWDYNWDEQEEIGIWSIKFHYAGDEAKLKTHVMKQIKGTSSYSDGRGCTMVPFVG